MEYILEEYIKSLGIRLNLYKSVVKSLVYKHPIGSAILYLLSEISVFTKQMQTLTNNMRRG